MVRKRKLISHQQPEESRKGQKEVPRVLPPPRILLLGIHLGWAMHVPPGRTLRLTPSHKTWCQPWSRAVLLGSPPYCSPHGHPFPIKSLALSACVSPWTIYFRELDKHPEHFPLPATNSNAGRDFLCCNWHPDHLGYSGTTHLPMDKTQWPQLRLFCPWSPLDMDKWPECPERVKTKRLYRPLSPSLSFLLLTLPTLLFFLVPQSWMQESGQRASG